MPSWVSEANLKAPLIAGVAYFNTDELSLITTHEVVERDILSIEKRHFVFGFNVVEIDDQRRLEFEGLIREVANVLDFSKDQDSIPMIAVIAHTSYAGDAIANETVALNRAKEFIQLMSQSGLPEEALMPIVSFVEDGQDAYPVRSVSFKVNYLKNTP